MAADLTQWPVEIMGDDRSADIRFRAGTGGEMSPAWASYMLNLWWRAGDKKLAFAEAVKQTAVHFMVGDQP